MAPFYDQQSDLSNFVISFTRDPKGDFAVFARAYAHAADRLAAQLLEALRFSDHEAYPVIFLYRHAFELSLKHIIYASALLARLADPHVATSTLEIEHELTKLSGKAASALERLFPNAAALRSIAVSATETAREFEEIAPKSYSYRYPIDRHGWHSSKPHQLVNLRAAAAHMSKLLGDLDTIAFGIHIETETAVRLCAVQSEDWLQGQGDMPSEGGIGGGCI